MHSAACSSTAPTLHLTSLTLVCLTPPPLHCDVTAHAASHRVPVITSAPTVQRRLTARTGNAWSVTSAQPHEY